MRSDERVVKLDACTEHCVHPETVRHVQSRALPGDDLVRVSAVFKLLGDPTRCRLLYALLEAGELCVCDLAAAAGVMEATVSQSLRLLRACGVVLARREGRLMFYRLADAHVRLLLDLTREHITHDPIPLSSSLRVDHGHPVASQGASPENPAVADQQRPARTGARR